MYEDVIAETTASDGTPFRVILEPDLDRTSLNPRDDYSNAGRIVALSRDSRSSGAPQEDGPDKYSRANAASIVDAIQDHPFRVVERWLRIFHGATVVLPLQDVSTTYGPAQLSVDTYAPETLRAGEYAGVTFDTPDTRADTMGDWVGPGPNPNAERDRETMARVLAADVETYRQWAEGDVWGYIVQTAWVDDGDGEITGWDAVDDMGASCWGFIGQQWAKEAAEEALNAVVAEYNERAAEAAQRDADDEAEIESLRRAELGIPEAVPAS